MLCHTKLYGPLTGYLKIPDIPGESERAEHEDEIDIHDIQWVISNPVQSDPTSGQRFSFGPVAGEVKASKYLDKSTPLLMEACAKGTYLDSVVITVRKDSGEAHLDYLIITMNRVLVTSIETLGSAEDGRIMENLSLNYGSVEMSYTRQNPDGSAGETTVFQWTVEQPLPQ